MKKVISKLTVTYLQDAAGVKAGTVKDLPDHLAIALEKRKIVSIGEVKTKPVTEAPVKAEPKAKATKKSNKK